MIRVENIPAAQLSDDQLAAWSRLQRSEPLFDSPYFRPEFTHAVASVRSDVEVAILDDGNETVGFFPFQRGKGNVGFPVGGKMSDFQAVICRANSDFSPLRLLESCGLCAWRFDHLVAGQERFRPYHWSVAGSPYIDLSQGWQEYERKQHDLHKSFFKRLSRRLRQVEREVGEARLEFNITDESVFSAMVELKRKQYKDTGVADVLSFPWTVELLRRVLTYKDEAFSGVLSALYLDDTLAAVLLSMKSYDLMHAWFSAYSETFAQYSPGLIFWMLLIKAPEMRSIRRIDLGKGPEEYKTHFMSDAIPVAEGRVDSKAVSGAVRRQCHRAYHWLRQTPLHRPLLIPGRFIRRMMEQKKFQ
ncbi:MAG: GNAT family N-acetyltransferase [Thermoguttaceae bacterium]